jgi:hypothetical protein
VDGPPEGLLDLAAVLVGLGLGLSSQPEALDLVNKIKDEQHEWLHGLNLVQVLAAGLGAGDVEGEDEDALALGKLKLSLVVRRLWSGVLCAFKTKVKRYILSICCFLSFLNIWGQCLYFFKCCPGWGANPGSFDINYFCIPKLYR